MAAAIEDLRVRSAAFVALRDAHDLRDVGAAGVRLTAYLPVDPDTAAVVDGLARG